MATQADVRRIALALPGAEEGKDKFVFFVRDKGKPKGFAWVWLERTEEKKKRVPNPGVLAVRVTNNAQKDLILASDTRKFFSEGHYDGYPAILVRLKEVTVADLRVLLEEAWRCRAPKELLAGRFGACVLLVAFCALAGCATVGVIGEKDAVAYARDNVCGVGAADSVCVVRSVERTQEGFRVVIDRRPPAGRDRLAVDVSGGLLSKVRIEATPIDTATRRP
jgi:hypothetical protein